MIQVQDPTQEETPKQELELEREEAQTPEQLAQFTDSTLEELMKNPTEELLSAYWQAQVDSTQALVEWGEDTGQIGWLQLANLNELLRTCDRHARCAREYLESDEYIRGFGFSLMLSDQCLTRQKIQETYEMFDATTRHYRLYESKSGVEWREAEGYFYRMVDGFMYRHPRPRNH